MTDDARRLRPVLAAFAGGAAAWLIAFGASLALAAGFRVMGVEDDRITGIVSRHFTGDAVRFLAFTAVAHLAFGLWFAVPVAALKKPSFGLAFFFALGASLALLGYGAGYRPALYSSWLYDRGGPAALVHVFLTRNPVAALALVLPAAAVVVARAVKSRDAVALFALILSLTGAGAMVFYRPPSRPVAAPASADKPDLVILAADSLRPDRLACYGGKRAVTPNISALCDGATMFEEAFVPTARTFPSWASILTGQPPWVHGVRNMFPDPERATLEEALPRRLALAGYETAVFSDYAGDVFPRMDAGFDIVHAPPFDFRTLVYIELLTAQKFLLPFIDTALGRRHVPLIDASAEASDARHLTDRVLAYLARPTTKPRLVVVFYSTTHFPFAVPYPDVDRFTAPD
ncbi:MAG: sulfatase-like hydrolase/transferase [Deltaproteobacteria bacterium]|nr:sulfatase-like hydrolase/transferase [Deltaproteobacteria bacterium]